jgi:hypothetical protein
MLTTPYEQEKILPRAHHLNVTITTPFKDFQFHAPECEVIRAWVGGLTATVDFNGDVRHDHALRINIGCITLRDLVGAYVDDLVCKLRKVDEGKIQDAGNELKVSHNLLRDGLRDCIAKLGTIEV